MVRVRSVDRSGPVFDVGFYSVDLSDVATDSCFLTVVAKNSTFRPRVVLTTSVTVRVRSVDRSGPVFDVGFYSVDISEDMATDSCFLQFYLTH